MMRTARKCDIGIVLAICVVIFAAALLGFTFVCEVGDVAEAATYYLTAVIYIDGESPSFSSIESVTYSTNPTASTPTYKTATLDTSELASTLTSGKVVDKVKTFEELGVATPTYCFRATSTTAPNNLAWIVKVRVMDEGVGEKILTYGVSGWKYTANTAFVLMLDDDCRLDTLEVPTIDETITYTGAAQTNPIKNLVESKLTSSFIKVTAPRTAINVGSYAVTLEPKTPATWSDGTTVKKEVSVQIAPADIQTCVVTQLNSLTYTGYSRPQLQSSDFTVKLGSRVMTQENYTFTAADDVIKFPGVYEVTLEGKENLTGTKIVQVDVSKADSLAGIVFHADKEYVYDPFGVKPKPTVAFGEDELEEGKDFVYTYNSNSSVGEKSGSVGIRTLATSDKFVEGLVASTVFDILAKPVTELNADFEIATYTGQPLTPKFKLWWETSDGNRVELNPSDIVIESWTNNVNAGTTASVNVQVRNNYSGTRQFEFEIKKAAFAETDEFEFNIDIPLDGYIYDAFEKTPQVTISFNGEDVSGQFAVTYDNNVNAGTAVAIVAPAVNGNFEGNPVSLQFDIAKAQLSDREFTLDYGEYINAVLAQATPTLTPEHRGSGRFVYEIVGDSYATVDPESGIVYSGEVGALGFITVRVKIQDDPNYIDGSYVECTLETVFEYGFAIEGAEDNKVYSTLKAAIDAIEGGGTILVKGSSDKLTLGGDVDVDANVTLRSEEDASPYAIDAAENDADAIKFGTTVNTEGCTFKVVKGGSLTLNDVTLSALNVFGIEELANNEFAVVEVDGGELTINSGGVAYGQNGGIRLKNGGKAEIKGGRICFNNAREGAGIYVERGCSLIVTGGKFTSNTAQDNGGAIFVEIDVSVDIEGATFEANSANAGGAIYFTGAEDTNDKLVVGGLDDSTAVTLLSNAATTHGGGIYIEDNASVTVNRAVADNNSSGGVGDFLYLAGARSELLLRASDSTVGVTDNIGIGAEAVHPYIPIKVLSTQLTHVINLFFAQEIVDNVDEEHEGGVYVHSDQATAKQLADNFRVINPGYTLVYAGRQQLRLGVSEDLVAFTEDLTGRASVQEAVDDTPDGTVYVAINVHIQNGEMNVRTSLEESITIVVGNKEATQSVVFKTVVHITNVVVDEGQGQVESSKEAFYVINGEQWAPLSEAYDGDLEAVKHEVESQTIYYGVSCNSARIVRAPDFNGTLVSVSDGASLTLENVVLDGGAVWGENGIVLEDEDGVAGTVKTNNTGIIGHAPLVVNRGRFKLTDGGILQNNDNNYQAPGEGFSAQNMGGGLRNEGAGKADINGGIIRYNYSRIGGAALNINKKYVTGTREQDGGYSEIPPTLTVSGGLIHNNAAQRVGSAIDTVYGGAVTNIEGGTIEDNFSLYDRGALSVREGGVLNVKNGTISVSEKNKYALLVYNLYSYEDYLLEYTADYVEGEKASVLNIGGVPQIRGTIYLEADCYVYNPTLPGEEPKYFAPVVHFTDYEGGPLDLAIDPARGYGNAVTTDGANVEEAVRVISAAKTNNAYDISKRFYYVTHSDTELALSGYDINAVQRSVNEMNISGKTDTADCVTETIEVNGAPVQLNIDENGNIGGGEGVNVMLSDPDGNFEISVHVEGTSADTHVEDGADATYKTYYIMLVRETGYITVPTETSVSYRAKDNTKKPLVSGILPNDARIGEYGNMLLYMGDDEEGTIVYVGKREAAPTLADEFGGIVTDFTDTQYTMQGKSGFEYALLTKNIDNTFEFVVDSPAAWHSSNNRTITFEGLQPSTTYYVTVRRSAGADTIPSEYIDLESDLGTFETLSEEFASRKDRFIEQYTQNEDRMIIWDGASFEIDITYSELKEMHELLIGNGQDVQPLPDSVMALARISKMDSKIRESMTYADAGLWKKQNAGALGLNGEDDAFYDNETVIAAALTSYHEIADNQDLNLSAADIRLQIKSEYDSLVELYKRIAEKKINDKVEAINTESVRAVAATYVALIVPVVDTYDVVIEDGDNAGTSEFMPAKAQIDTIYARAVAAINVQNTYDKLLSHWSEKMSESSKDSALNTLVATMADINKAREARCDEIATSGIRELYVGVAKGVIELHFTGIVQSAGEKGIVAEYLDTVIDGSVETVRSFVDARDEAYAAVESAQNNDDIEDIVKNALLKLSREEGKAIIECYLAWTELADDGAENTVVIADDETTVAVAREWQAKIDTSAEGEIENNVFLAKRAIEISRAGIYLRNYFNERNGIGGDAPTDYGRDLLEEYTTSIEVANDGYEAWILAEEGKQLISVEAAKQIALKELETDTPVIQGEKTALIEQFITEIVNAVTQAATEFTRADTLAETKFKAAETFGAAVNEKLLVMYEELASYDRDRFVEDHADFVGEAKRPAEQMTAGDIAAIDEALADLANTYSLASQYMLDDLRHDLLECKKAALYDMLDNQSDGSEAVQRAIDSFKAQLANVALPTYDHSPAEDEIVNGVLTAMIDNINNAIGFEKYKNRKLAELENYRESGDSAAVNEQFTEALNAMSQLSYSSAFEYAQQTSDLDDMAREGMAKVNIRRFKDANPTIENGGSADDYASLVEAYATLEEDLRAKGVAENVISETVDLFDAEAGEYGNYLNMLKDMGARQTFNEEKVVKTSELINVKRDKDDARTNNVFETQLGQVEAFVYESQYVDDDNARTAYLADRRADLDNLVASAKAEVKLAQSVQDAKERVNEDLTAKKNSGSYSAAQIGALEALATACAAALEAVTVEQGVDMIEQIAAESMAEMNAVAVTNVGSEHIRPDGTPDGKYASDDPDELWGAAKAIDGELPRGVEVRAQKKTDASGDVVSDLINGNDYCAADGNEIEDDKLYSLISGKIFCATIDVYLDLEGARFAPDSGLYEVRILIPAKLAALDGLQVVYAADGMLEVYDTRVEEIGDHKFLVFRTAHFSDFTILADKPVQLGWLIGVLTAIALIEAAAVIYLCFKYAKLKKSGVRTMALAPLALMGAVAPAGAGTACIALALVAAALGIAIIVLSAVTRKLAQSVEEERVFVREKNDLKKLFDDNSDEQTGDKN